MRVPWVYLCFGNLVKVDDILLAAVCQAPANNQAVTYADIKKQVISRTAKSIKQNSYRKKARRIYIGMQQNLLNLKIVTKNGD